MPLRLFSKPPPPPPPAVPNCGKRVDKSVHIGIVTNFHGDRAFLIRFFFHYFLKICIKYYKIVIVLLLSLILERIFSVGASCRIPVVSPNFGFIFTEETRDERRFLAGFRRKPAVEVVSKNLCTHKCSLGHCGLNFYGSFRRTPFSFSGPTSD